MNKEDMLSKLNEDLSREYAHWHFYLHAAAKVVGLHREEYSEFFEEAAKSEMGHILAFKKMIVGLGGEPICYNAPFEISLTDPLDLLKEALRMEEQVVKEYVDRIDHAQELQANGGQDKVDGKWIELFLEGQIEDSRADADELKEMVK